MDKNQTPQNQQHRLFLPQPLPHTQHHTNNENFDFLSYPPPPLPPSFVPYAPPAQRAYATSTDPTADWQGLNHPKPLLPTPLTQICTPTTQEPLATATPTATEPQVSNYQQTPTPTPRCVLEQRAPSLDEITPTLQSEALSGQLTDLPIPVQNQNHPDTQGQAAPKDRPAPAHDQAVVTIDDNKTIQQTTIDSDKNNETPTPVSSQPKTTHSAQNWVGPTLPQFYDQYQSYSYGQPLAVQTNNSQLSNNNYRMAANQQPVINNQQGPPKTDQTGFHSYPNFFPNIPPPNFDWNPLQQPGLNSAHQSATSTAASYSQNHPITTSATIGANVQPSTYTSCSHDLFKTGAYGAGFSPATTFANTGVSVQQTSTTAGKSGIGGSSHQLYPPQVPASFGSSMPPMVQHQPPFGHSYQPSTSTADVTSAADFMGTSDDFMPLVPASLNTSMMNQHPPHFGNQNYNYFPGNGQGMFATSVEGNEEEKRRRTVGQYANENLHQLYMSDHIKKRLVINPNVEISAEMNDELFQQCSRQGGSLDAKTLQRLSASVKISSAGQSHDFASFGMVDENTASYPAPAGPYAIQHQSYMRPPPPYPMNHRLAIDVARNEAKEAEAEMAASRERRELVEKKIVDSEKTRRKQNKARSHRMTANQREAYLRYQYSGRETRNTRNYMNNSDEGLEEAVMQLELLGARNAEIRAHEKMKAANQKLQSQIEAAARIEASLQTQQPPTAYGRNANSAGGPMKQPAKRGRKAQNHQTTTRKSKAPAHEYVNPPSMPQPPSYPGTSRANTRSQQYQTPGSSYQMPNTGRNPPDYFQAVGAGQSEFRTQHPRRIVPPAAYGSGCSRCGLFYCNNMCHRTTTTSHQAPKRQVSREPQVQPQAPSTVPQQYNVAAMQGNRNSSTDAHSTTQRPNSQNVQASNQYITQIPTGYPARQPQSSSSVSTEQYSNRMPWTEQGNRIPGRACSYYDNRQMPYTTEPPAYFQTAMPSTTARAQHTSWTGTGTSAGTATPKSQQPTTTSRVTHSETHTSMAAPASQGSGQTTASSVSGTSGRKDQYHGATPIPFSTTISTHHPTGVIDVDNIENLVPTLPTIPNMLFERCLNDMNPKDPKQVQKTSDSSASGASGTRGQYQGATPTPSSSTISTHRPSSESAASGAIGTRGQYQGATPTPSSSTTSTHRPSMDTRASGSVGRLQTPGTAREPSAPTTTILNPIVETSQQTQTQETARRQSALTTPTSHPNVETSLQTQTQVTARRQSASTTPTRQPRGRRGTRSTTRPQHPAHTKPSIDRMLEHYLAEQRRDGDGIAEDFIEIID